MRYRSGNGDGIWGWDMGMGYGDGVGGWGVGIRYTVRPEGWEKMTLLRHNYISFLCKIQPQTSIITMTNSGK